MKVIVAIDSFKGCLSSREANLAAAEGIRAVCPDAEVVQVPVSDGGEGFVDAFRDYLGGTVVEVSVRDPLMRPITARYLLGQDEQGVPMAVIEVAQACGLTLLRHDDTTGEDERNPLVATSYGVGQLVADAVCKGARHIIVGLGGSATSDAGVGMLKALIDSFARHGRWDDVDALRGIRFTIATDVRNPLYGPNGAARVFAPQKGASPADVVVLDRRARTFAEVSACHQGHDCSQKEGAGAAGGLGYAFMQYLDAECKSGIQLLLETIGFSQLLVHADFVITGEGAADRQTLMGKLPMGVLQLAEGTPVWLVAGRIADREALLHAGFAQVACINPAGMAHAVAMRKEVAMRNIALTVGSLCESVKKA